ncbi:hypothetical protein C0J52_27627 [Blattella germanica]|nr:hypothetical protein C0J52_27627 [Blattella germanica]
MADAPEKTTNHPVYKLYRRRWFLLAVFFCFSGGNSFQWIQYSIISNLVSKYYDVSSLFVDFTSIVFMVAFIPFIFWASNLIDRKVSRNYYHFHHYSRGSIHVTRIASKLLRLCRRNRKYFQYMQSILFHIMQNCIIL